MTTIQHLRTTIKYYSSMADAFIDRGLEAPTEFERAQCATVARQAMYKAMIARADLQKLVQAHVR
jgi:hypothetical protein